MNKINSFVIIVLWFGFGANSSNDWDAAKSKIDALQVTANNIEAQTKTKTKTSELLGTLSANSGTPAATAVAQSIIKNIDALTGNDEYAAISAGFDIGANIAAALPGAGPMVSVICSLASSLFGFGAAKGPSTAELIQKVIDHIDTKFAEQEIIDLKQLLTATQAHYHQYATKLIVINKVKFTQNFDCMTFDTWTDFYSVAQADMIRDTEFLSHAKTLLLYWKSTYARVADCLWIVEAYFSVASLRLFALLSYQGEAQTQIMCDENEDNKQKYLIQYEDAAEAVKSLITEATSMLKILDEAKISDMEFIRKVSLSSDENRPNLDQWLDFQYSQDLKQIITDIHNSGVMFSLPIFPSNRAPHFTQYIDWRECPEGSFITKIHLFEAVDGAISTIGFRCEDAIDSSIITVVGGGNLKGSNCDGDEHLIGGISNFVDQYGLRGVEYQCVSYYITPDMVQASGTLPVQVLSTFNSFWRRLEHGQWGDINYCPPRQATYALLHWVAHGFLEGTQGIAAKCRRLPNDPYQLIGCFADQIPRALRYGPMEWAYTISACGDRCNELGFPYFALQAGGWCSCDNDGIHATIYGPSTGCPDDGLGGDWANNVFEYVEAVWIGCYEDTLDRALRFGPMSWGYSISSCDKECKSLGHLYFALQAGGWCSCESDYSHATMYDISTHCPDNRLGGDWVNDVFYVS